MAGRIDDTTGTDSAGADTARATQRARDEMLLASRPVDALVRQTDLSVPGIHCGGCIRTVETALAALDGVERARVNLSTRRVAVHWRADRDPPPLIETLQRIGYDAHLYDRSTEKKDETLSALIRALAVAGFASGNIMMLSVAIWSGADDAMRDLFHWISAAIAVPALLYGGRVFFRSAWNSLRHGRTNMDVPISIGVSLAFAMSLYDTINHGEHAYFDAVTSLLFFLLIGRTLDHVMREKARTAVKGLARLAARGAMVARPDGSREYVPVQELAPGMTILLGVGERVPVDARVEEGASDIDCALALGESLPQSVSAGSRLLAGTLNLTGPLTITATAAADDSFLAEMLRLMEAAEGGRSAYRRIADRAAQLYAPVVHLTALLAFAGWMIAGGDVHRAITIAIAVLIITCPCALALAVPMVQVVAARRLFEAGIMVKDGSALERLGEIDTIVFDKTGTLTRGDLQAVRPPGLDDDSFAIAAAMGACSRHPQSRALAALAPSSRPAPRFDRIDERPGLGMEAVAGGAVYRLGRPDWAGNSTGGGTSFAKDGREIARFRFNDRLRQDAREAVTTLSRRGVALEILSGDEASSVASVAAALGVSTFHAQALPADKLARLASLAAAGRKVLMVGDGLNDAPALAAAHASMAPSTAADVGRQAADVVFLRESLDAVPLTLDVARRAGRLIRQNFALAVAYNLIAAPIALAGLVTPLVAALAMSLSSIIVIGNALRLGLGGAGDGARQHRTGRRRSPAARALAAP